MTIYNAWYSADGTRHDTRHGPFAFWWRFLLWSIDFWWRLQFRVAPLVCRLFGHRLEVESDVSPDAGSEDLHCTRCGHTNHITYY